MADTKKFCPINFSPIIKVVGSACNLRCKYCYYEGRHDEKLNVMSIETAKKIIDKFYEYNINNKLKQLTIIWHGGEPLLAGLHFFKEIFEYTKKYSSENFQIKHGLQTNATLLDKKWCKLFKENDVGVGISLDGPKALHDTNRIFLNGNGSYKETIQGIKSLKEEGLPINLISVITKLTIEYPVQKFIDFFYSLKANSCSLNVLTNNKQAVSLNELSIDYLSYTKFLIKVFNQWIERDDSNLMIKPFEDIIKLYLKKQTFSCIFSGHCETNISISPQGEVYNCCAGYDEQPSMANISKQTITNLIDSEKFSKLLNSQKIQKNDCNSCKWMNFCNGGCPRERKIFLRNKIDSSFCEGRKLLFNTIFKKIKEVKENEKHTLKY